MAKKRAGHTQDAGSEDSSAGSTKPKFPYTTKPGSLRRFLQQIPQKPKPEAITPTLLKAWGFRDSNDRTIIRVLKAVGLVNANSQPTEIYSNFMKLNDGAKALGPEIKRVYAKLFEASHAPYNEDNATLKNLFNIHSGGGQSVLEMQIQTFKALAEQASFGKEDALSSGASSASPVGTSGGGGVDQQAGPIIHIDLHIHLPENKTQRDYENIIEDIGRHIFGRNTGGKSA